MNTLKSNWYKAWRQSEAYAVPTTEEGMRKADLRAESFRVGFEYGIKTAAAHLEAEHSKAKKDHSFFYKASQLIRGIK